MSLAYQGVTLQGMLEGGYGCGGIFADTFFYGFEPGAPLLPVPRGTALHIDGAEEIRTLRISPVGETRGSRLEIYDGVVIIAKPPGGYTLSATVGWETSSITVGFPIQVVPADSPVPLARITFPESRDTAILSFEGSEATARPAPTKWKGHEIQVEPLTHPETTISLPFDAQVWIDASVISDTFAWLPMPDGSDTDPTAVEFDHYDAMGVDLSEFDPGTYQFLIGIRGPRRQTVGFSFSVEIQPPR